MNSFDFDNIPLFLPEDLIREVVDENEAIVRTIRMAPPGWLWRNTASNRIDRIVLSIDHQEASSRLEKDRVLVASVGAREGRFRSCMESWLELEKLLELFNHLRERYDRLIDTADESTLDEILSTDHFLIGEAE